MKINIRKNILYVLEYVLLFFVYGFIYFVIETIYKGHFSDWRMFLLGGILGILIGMQNNVFTYDTNFIYQCIFGSIIITLCEAVFGYQWNTIEGLGIWDYTNTIIYGVAGNVSLVFSVFAWVPLSGICIMVDDWFWYHILKNGTRPYYIFFKKKHVIPFI